MVHKSRYVTCWQARVVFDPSAHHLCGWFVMAFDSASEQDDDSVSCCSGDPWLSFRHRAVSESRAMQSKLVMWKSWDFLTQFVQVIIWLLVKWQWGVAELAFARSRMGCLIEAVSRSAKERVATRSLYCEGSWSPLNVSCAEHLWNVILKSEHFSVIWKVEQLSFWVIKCCASVKLMLST